jgi:hypothetical protein
MGDKELGAGAVASVKQEIEAVSATTMLESAADPEKRARRGGHGMSPVLARNVPCIVELVPIEGAAHERRFTDESRSSLRTSSWSSALSRW